MWFVPGVGAGTTAYVQHTSASPFAGYVNAVAFRQMEMLVSGGQDGTVRVWNREAERQKTPGGHTNYISTVAVSCDGSFFVTGGYDKCVKVCAAVKREGRRITDGSFALLSAVQFLTDVEFERRAFVDC